MHRLVPSVLSLLLAVAVAACGTTASTADGDDPVGGVYVGRFNQSFESTELVVELRQRGRRLSGTYTLRSTGGIEEGRLSGIFTDGVVQLQFIGMDSDAEFVGTASGTGAVIEGQLDLGTGATYTLTLRKG